MNCRFSSRTFVSSPACPITLTRLSHAVVVGQVSQAEIPQLFGRPGNGLGIHRNLEGSGKGQGVARKPRVFSMQKLVEVRGWAWWQRRVKGGGWLPASRAFVRHESLGCVLSLVLRSPWVTIEACRSRGSTCPCRIYGGGWFSILAAFLRRHRLVGEEPARMYHCFFHRGPLMPAILKARRPLPGGG